ncbi:hypothetical protein BDK51DRAFT_47876 [Blyttiomyces helicus]|uniref:Sodium/calcium exchanger membrane region domain-containing protein n=1 Tax=Blyttiomyces helicus TaxID=388810 RepID=A0A4P9VW28_9FUNG|nr:hypothetical protein BDK51DRAFT_47876 [Blyttiomyces helicus]|eukprot:RKO83899.1 hypothetical protein BDK51DRAFT_47876 [Blyttiomyces helicus]
MSGSCSNLLICTLIAVPISVAGDRRDAEFKWAVCLVLAIAAATGAPLILFGARAIRVWTELKTAHAMAYDVEPGLTTEQNNSNLLADSSIFP